ncbi:MAG: MarC family protein [Candidatus Aminicenantes bacterium]|nr:MarC family protein [Candidatus Aminicenantes bacterium]
MLAETLNNLLSGFTAFIALVNPVQKIFVIHSLQKQFDEKTTRFISIKSTITALVILVTFLAAGHVIFNYVFHIELYAFQITCGIVLFYNGLTGLQKGVFFRLDKNVSIKDLTAVPIAVPMIAGPATITAAVTFPPDYGPALTVAAIVLALAVNLVFMLFARRIGDLLIRFNLMNPLIRIFGLIVATIGVQLVLNGIGGFIADIRGMTG